MSPRTRSLTVLVAGLVGLGFATPPPVRADELMPGHLEGEGTHFEVTGSEYLNLTVDSSELVWTRIGSIPGLVTIEIESVGGAPSAVLTLGGLAPSTTYYAYEDDYHNGSAFVTDELGSYPFTQDLTAPHLLLIQPTPSTRFIPSDPDIGTWDGVNRVYTLTTDVPGTIQIDESNLTLRGADHSVIGSGSGYGVYITAQNNVTIENLHVQGFAVGIDVYGAGFGSPIIIRDNDVHDNTFGMAIAGVVLLQDNVAWNNDQYGIFMTLNAQGTVTGNGMFDNGWNLYLDGLHSSLQLDTSNTVDGRPVYWVYGETGTVYDASTNAGTFYALDCDGVTIRDLTPSNTGQGVFLRNTHNSTIENVQTSNTQQGIKLSLSTNNRVINNTFTDDDGVGIRLYSGIRLHQSSTGNVVADNTATGYNNGIDLVWDSDDNELIGNTTSNCHVGVLLLNSDGNLVAGGTSTANDWRGIELWYANANTITGYSISDSPQVANIFYSHGNTFTENVFDFYHTNQWGMQFSGSNLNQVYNNNFIDDAHDYRVRVSPDSTGNVFNLPAPIGGNYWAGWTEPDADGDGFVDLPYVLDGGQDDLPWATPDGWVQDPAEMIAALIEHVLSLNLQHGIENSLDSKLEAALQAIEDVNDNNDVAAINVLQAFVSAVQAQSGNQIPEADALDLEIEALEIIDLLLSG